MRNDDPRRLRRPTRNGCRAQGFGFYVWDESPREAHLAADDLAWASRVLQRARREAAAPRPPRGPGFPPDLEG